jgi:hypothetical protein
MNPYTYGSGFAGSTALATTSWHQVVATWDGATERIYVDGVQQTAGARAAPIGTDDRVLYLGGRAAAEDSLRGVLDEARISGRARPAAWILTQYRNQSVPSTFSRLGAQEVR